MISAAEITNVDAIHPGYGLLSENANFAEVCESSHIKFIGPPPEVIRLMGEKEKARQAMKKAKVPILPGSDGVIASAEEAREWATQIGYPVIVKASAGGGGRGMRVIRNESELEGSFNSAQSEAAAAFGNGNLYMEKFIERPRQIQFRVLGDSHCPASISLKASANAASSGGTRSCWKNRLPRAVTPEMRAEIGQGLRKSRSLKSATSMPVQLNF